MHTHTIRPLVQRFWRGSSLVMLGIGLLVQPPQQAVGGAPNAPDGRCTARNVAGTYGFVGSGTILPHTVGLPEGLFATVGLLRFNGQDRWQTANQSLTINGVVSTGASMAGTYTVQPDCTFTLANDMGNVDAGVFVHDRQEGFFMATVEGVIVTFTMKRVEKQDE